MIGESALPDFTRAADKAPEGVGVSALDELSGMFERYVLCWRQKDVEVLRHYNEGVNLKSSFAPIAINCLQEESDIVFYDEEFSAVPGRKGNEVSSGRRGESARLQERTSAAKAAIFVYPKSARVELVPFPVNFVKFFLVLGKWQC